MYVESFNFVWKKNVLGWWKFEMVDQVELCGRTTTIRIGMLKQNHSQHCACKCCKLLSTSTFRLELQIAAVTLSHKKLNKYSAQQTVDDFYFLELYRH